MLPMIERCIDRVTRFPLINSESVLSYEVADDLMTPKQQRDEDKTNRSIVEDDKVLSSDNESL